MLRQETICDLCGKPLGDFDRSYRVQRKRITFDWFQSQWVNIDCHSECAELLYKVATRLELLHGRLIEADKVKTIRYSPDEIQAIIDNCMPTIIPANTLKYEEDDE